jgi:triphosphoribosyl-dephospho-CoA synthase
MISCELDLAQLATAACLLELAAPKPGNVHRAADFEHMTFYDMCLGAVAVGPAIQSAPQVGVGRAVLAAVQATQDLVGKNTNLGTILLLAPLACADRERPTDVAKALDSLTSHDARDIYQAIRLARPGGLGTSKLHDVADEAPTDLIAAMKNAAGRDLVARQYANGFRELSDHVVPWLGKAFDAGYNLPTAIVYVQMQVMRQYPDSLIARKRGIEVADESAARAAEVLAAGTPGDARYEEALANFDFWLRSDQHARNPGTTADMIAAGLFVGLRSGMLDTARVARAIQV